MPRFLASTTSWSLPAISVTARPRCGNWSTAESFTAARARHCGVKHMTDVTSWQKRRLDLTRRYLSNGLGEPASVQTGGVDHLALICADLDATIRFYVEVLGMRLTRIVENRDDPTSTHIFFDMGGGNQLAFFDFPHKGPAPTVR